MHLRRRYVVTRARKRHICARCGKWIAKGALYKRWTWFEPGEPPSSWAAHVLCDHLDVGRDDYDDMLDEQYGEIEWGELLRAHAPESWIDGEFWPPIFHDELAALLGGA